MKKFISIFLSVIISISFFTVYSYAFAGTTYYVDSINGNDENNGTDINSPFKSVEPLKKIGNFLPGDKILFKNGGVYECIFTLSSSGTKEAPIVISSYGEGNKAILTTLHITEVLRLFDCSYVTVSDLCISAQNGGGIWIDTRTKTSEGITLDNLYFTNIQNYKVNSRDILSEGATIARAGVMVKGLPARSIYPVNNLTIKNCEVYNCANGFSIWGSRNAQQDPWCDLEDIDPIYNEGILIENCYFHEMDAEAVVIGVCDGALVTNCRAINCCQGEGVDEGGDPLYYTAAMWFWGSINSTIQYCEIAGQKNVGDGMAIDFDSYSHNCTYQYIYSHDNTRFVCNCSDHDGHRGNTVRYCLSVNDNRGESEIAGSPGEHGFKFYNNTIINCGDFDITDLHDSVFANNIIIPAKGCAVTGSFSELLFSNNYFASNCYYNTINPLIDITSMNTIPGFSENEFALSKDSPLIGAGIQIDGAPEYDFYGNKITSQNIGCYGGDGVDFKYESESFFVKILRLIINFFDILINRISLIFE